MKKRPFALFILLFFALLVLFALSILLGAAKISAKEIICAFFSGQHTAESNIVLYVRLPRTIAGIFGGAGLALSGAIIQSVLKNPLGSPNIIGVNSGALFFLLLSSIIFPQSAVSRPIAAFFGSLFAVTAVSALSGKAGGSKYTVILAGVVLNTLFAALIDAVQTFAPDSIYERSAFRIGSLAFVQTKILYPASICIASAIFFAVAFSDSLDVLALGDESAESLGLNVRRTRIFALAIAALSAGASVSFTGLLGFVGLIVPHIVRSLAGGSMRRLSLLSALGGADLVLACDLLSRVLFAPSELPVGIFLSLLGGVFFLVLLVKGRMEE